MSEADESGTDRLKRRRAELGAFLRARRRALGPGDVGIATVGRRHVKGLRREEVAALAGIGVSWYTLLEQGVVRRVSDRTLLAIAAALRLGEVERAHVLALAAGDVPDDARAAAVTQPVVTVVEQIVAGPAYLLSPRYDVVAWNRAAGDIFGFGDRPPHERNLLRAMLFDPQAKHVFITWDQALRDMIAVVHANYARNGGAAFDTFVDELSAESPLFQEIWTARDVGAVPTHELCVMRLSDGTVTAAHLAAFSPHDAPAYTVIVIVPTGEPYEMGTSGGTGFGPAAPSASPSANASSTAS